MPIEFFSSNLCLHHLLLYSSLFFFFLLELSCSYSMPQSSSSRSLAERVRRTLTEANLLEVSEPLPCPQPTSFQSQNVDETPPLPPLPPMEWRLGKLRLGSPSSAGKTNQPQLTTSPSMELTGDDKYAQGWITAAVVQPGNTFTSFPVAEDEQFRPGSLISVDEVVKSSRLCELPPIIDEERKHRPLHLDGELANSSSPFQVVAAHIEGGKLLSGHDASVPTLEDVTAKYPQLLQGEGQDGQQRRPQLVRLLPSLELEGSQHEALSISPNPMLSTNPFFMGSSTEEWERHYAYGAHGGESVQHLNLSAPAVRRGSNMPPYGFLYPIGENISTLYDFMIPRTESGKPNWRYGSIRNRPRDPLIEAVAALDRSTLRKVSELPKEDERNSFLEQIKNKSFNLKPANAKKPNVKGVPPTNLKVAAILDKVNAVRQACTGSDEQEDDGVSWSDS